MSDLDTKVTEACHRIEELFYETDATRDAQEVSTTFEINQNRRTDHHI